MVLVGYMSLNAGLRESTEVSERNGVRIAGVRTSPSGYMGVPQEERSITEPLCVIENMARPESFELPTL
jgi:hypothetical protein